MHFFLSDLSIYTFFLPDDLISGLSPPPSNPFHIYLAQSVYAWNIFSLIMPLIQLLTHI